MCWSGHATCQAHGRDIDPSSRCHSCAALPSRPSLLPKKLSGMAADGPLQHGVGFKDGAKKMTKSIQYFSEADPPESLSPLTSRQPSRIQTGDAPQPRPSHGVLALVHGLHLAPHAHIPANSGIDQGCSLSPCGFAAAVEPISRFILSETHRVLDSGQTLGLPGRLVPLGFTATHPSSH